MLRFRSSFACLLRYPRQIHNFQRNESSSAQNKPTKTAEKKSQIDPEVHLNYNISTKVQEKLPCRAPFIKNFFLGKVDRVLIPYPEVISREDLEKLNNEISEIKNFFNNKLDVKQIEATRCVPKQVHNDLKSLGMFGLNIPQHLGGKGLFASESCIATEPETISSDISTILSSHRLVVDVIEKFGTKDQKARFLPKLADGSYLATEAIFENEVPENKFFNTTAHLEPSDKVWIIKGEKSFVLGTKDANIYLVMAETQKISISGDMESGVSMFLVDSSSQGVSQSNALMTLGLRGSGCCTVCFQNVKVPENCIIGEINGGNEIAQYLLKSHRIKTALLAVGWTKQLINAITEHCITTKQCGISITELDIVGNKISKLLASTHAAESMIYFVAGLIDEFDNQDVDIEAAITKLYSIESLWNAVTTSMEFLGPKALLSGHAVEALLRNTAQLYTHGESIDSLRLFIGMSGLQHAGMSIHETVKKERNPLFHPGHMFGKFFDSQSIEHPKLILQLKDELHPSLEPAAQCLEQSVVRLEICTNLLLTRYGTGIIEQHVEVQRLTEMVKLIFAIFASISRASRSYCIGLRHSDYELLIATSVALDGRNRVKELAVEIANGPVLTNDNNYKRLSKQVYKSRGYFPEHPLTYNF